MCSLSCVSVWSKLWVTLNVWERRDNFQWIINLFCACILDNFITVCVYIYVNFVKLYPLHCNFLLVIAILHYLEKWCTTSSCGDCMICLSPPNFRLSCIISVDVQNKEQEREKIVANRIYRDVSPSPNEPVSYVLIIVLIMWNNL